MGSHQNRTNFPIAGHSFEIQEKKVGFIKRKKKVGLRQKNENILIKKVLHFIIFLLENEASFPLKHFQSICAFSNREGKRRDLLSLVFKLMKLATAVISTAFTFEIIKVLRRARFPT